MQSSRILFDYGEINRCDGNLFNKHKMAAVFLPVIDF